MNKLFKGIMSATALLSVGVAVAASCDSDCPTLKCYKRRSDSRHKYIQVAGSVDKAHLGDAESMYGVFTVTPGYRGSFKHKDIAKCLFGDHLANNDGCCDPIIKIEGSNIASRDPKAWLADYFYLPRNYKGSFKVEPRIKTFFLDLDLFVGLDDWLCGLYFRLWGDVVHTSWNLGFCEKSGTEGTALDHPNGYFSPAPYEADLLLKSFGEYAKGDIPKTSNNNGTGNSEVTIISGSISNSTLKAQGLKYAKILKCSKSETGFADLRGELGWDFWQSECYHLGLNFQFAAPTGQKKEPCVLFDAMVGNGNHWEVGGGVTGHYVFWKSEDAERTFSFHLDANLTHLFKERVQRTFDLSNRPNSAYMLAAKFGPNTATNPADGVQADATPNVIPAKQFAGEYAPVANLSTTSVDVSIGVQSDIVAMFNYTCGSFSWDLGYNFWGNSCEKFDCADSCKNSQSLCNSNQASTWALKGDARMFGFEGTGTDPNSIPLSATQSEATILNGRNQVVEMMAIVNDTLVNNNANFDQNINIDSPCRAETSPGGADLFTVPTGTLGLIQTSKTPKFLNCDDLDYTRIKSLSHTLFTNLSYSWERDCWSPFMGLGFSAEFGSNGSCCDDDSSNTGTGIGCGPCVECSLSQWGLWVMGGVTFN